jgi:hypothetical protein
MTLWDSGNLWFSERYFANVLGYPDWAAYKRDRPYDSPIWLGRGLRAISWSTRVDPTFFNYRFMQIVFMISNPHTELLAWTFRVQDSEEEELRAFLATLVPSYWKNLMDT